MPRAKPKWKAIEWPDDPGPGWHWHVALMLGSTMVMLEGEPYATEEDANAAIERPDRMDPQVALDAMGAIE